MALDASKVRVGVTGVAMVGPTTAAAPTSTTSATTGYTDLGYVSDDGLTEARERSTDQIKAWQNGATVRTLITDAKLTYKFTLLETSLATIEYSYGVTVTQTVTHGRYVIDPSATGGRKSNILDVIDGTNKKRIYLPDAEVTEVGEVVYANGEPIGYEVTVEAYYKDSLGGCAEVFETALKT